MFPPSVWLNPPTEDLTLTFEENWWKTRAIGSSSSACALFPGKRTYIRLCLIKELSKGLWFLGATDKENQATSKWSLVTPNPSCAQLLPPTGAEIGPGSPKASLAPSFWILWVLTSLFIIINADINWIISMYLRLCWVVNLYALLHIIFIT